PFGEHSPPGPPPARHPRPPGTRNRRRRGPAGAQEGPRTHDVEGQVNGRLSCSGVISAAYDPHALTPEEKDSLAAPDPGDYVVRFDLKHTEVAILQWLSQDQALAAVLDRNDFDRDVLIQVTGIRDPNEAQRRVAKEPFLRLRYG